MKSVRETINGISVCLSKGRKRQYFCSVCGHSDIEEWYGQHYTCNNCGVEGNWKSRASVAFNGTPLETLAVPVKLQAEQEAEHLTYERNHEPHEQGIWFDYTGFRFKDYYDIELFDGQIIKNCRPNGNGWYGNGERDHHVKRVRLKPDEELEFDFLTGQERIDHQLKLFG